MSSWRRVVRVGVEEEAGAGVVVFLDRGIVSPWKGVVAVDTVVASNRPHGKPAGAAGEPEGASQS